jgi:N-acetylmuramoyl-L-alanine amidase
MKLKILENQYSRKFVLLLGVLIIVVIALNLLLLLQSSNHPLKGKNIMIDAGHGGADTGSSDGSGFLEKDINLDVALALRDVLTKEKAHVEMTRDSDFSLENMNNLSSNSSIRDMISRISIINSGKYDLFVSIHVNCSVNREAMGPVVVYSAKSPENEVLAESIQNELNVHSAKTLESSFKYKPITSEPFILRSAVIPGIIVETGFISNSKDREMLCDASYKLKLAKSICSGIQNYYKEMKRIEKKGKQVNSDSGDQGLPFNMTNDIQLVEVH